MLIENPIHILDTQTFWLSTNNRMINMNEPCRVDIYCTPEKKWFVLNMVKGSRSFYFPYLNGGKAGCIEIPDKCENGTIAITGSMNGCALEVRYSLDKKCYIFYHDANGKSMPPPSSQDTTVCRIVANHYWDDNFDKESSEQGSLVTVQFICVYYMEQWHVGCSAVLLKSKFDAATIQYVHKILTPKNGRYKGCFNKQRSLILI